jgi:hypothetical protein
MNRFKQLEGEGEVWKEPPGPEVADLEGAEFEDAMTLEVGDGLPLLDAVFEHLGMAVPWNEDSELDVKATQRLATKLKPLDWAAVAKKGVELGDDEAAGAELWERWRAFVVDAARSCNGLVFELDEW